MLRLVLIAHKEKRASDVVEANNQKINEYNHRIQEKDSIITNLSYAEDLKAEIEALEQQKEMFAEQKEMMQPEIERLGALNQNFEKTFMEDI